MVYLNEYSLTLRTGVVNPPDLVPAVRQLRDVVVSMFEDSEGLVGCTTGGPPETCHTEVDGDLPTCPRAATPSSGRQQPAGPGGGSTRRRALISSVLVLPH